MAHNTYTRTLGTWAYGTKVLSSEFASLDTKTFQAVNGDLGGTWAPVAPIEIAGTGMTLSGPVAVSGALTATGTTAIGSAITIAGAGMALSQALAITGAAITMGAGASLRGDSTKFVITGGGGGIQYDPPREFSHFPVPFYAFANSALNVTAEPDGFFTVPAGGNLLLHVILPVAASITVVGVAIVGQIISPSGSAVTPALTLSLQHYPYDGVTATNHFTVAHGATTEVGFNTPHVLEATIADTVTGPDSPYFVTINRRHAIFIDNNDEGGRLAKIGFPYISGTVSSAGAL